MILRRRRPCPAGLERELERRERRLRVQVRRELRRELIALQEYVDGELDAVDSRIDGVLTRSMRALNRSTGGREA